MVTDQINVEDAGAGTHCIHRRRNNFNGISRDGERFVIGSNGDIWYTDSHYGQGTSLNGIDDFIQIIFSR